MGFLLIVGLGVIIYFVGKADEKKYTDKNKQYLDSYNHYNKVNVPEKKLIRQSNQHRVNVCHRCKSSVNNQKHKTCSECGWITCPSCGACEYYCTGKKTNNDQTAISNEPVLPKPLTERQIKNRKKFYGDAYDKHVRKEFFERGPITDTEVFLFYLSPKIRDGIELNKYETFLFKKVFSSLSSRDDQFNNVNEWCKTGKGSSKIIDVLIENAKRKKKPWWDTINSMYETQVNPSFEYGYEPMAGVEDRYDDVDIDHIISPSEGSPY